MAQEKVGGTGRDRLLLALRSQNPHSQAPGTPQSFQNADLTGLKLTRAMLRGMDLRGARLSGAVLDGADLTGTDLRGADLSGASLCSAHLISTDLRGADLSRADLTDANLYRARLAGASLRHANLSGAGLNESQLEDVDLREANLRDCKLVRAQLQGARLDSANLQRAYLSEAILTGAMLISADLREANLSGADLEGADLRGADLCKANLEGCRGTPAARGNTNLSASTYRKSGWQNADIVEWLQAGSILVDPEHLPQLEHHHLFSVQLGLILNFQVHIQSTDWFALYAFITAHRERFPGSNMRVVAFHETEAATTVRILADDSDAMVAFADVLAGRIWESPQPVGAPEEAFIDSLIMMAPRIREQLSWLVDRVRCFELYVIEETALKKARQWSITVDRRAVFVRLLDVLFSPLKLSRWLQDRSSKPMIPLNGVGSRWALQHLEASDEITPALFNELILESPELAQDILLIGRLWKIPVS